MGRFITTPPCSLAPCHGRENSSSDNILNTRKHGPALTAIGIMRPSSRLWSPMSPVWGGRQHLSNGTDTAGSQRCSMALRGGGLVLQLLIRTKSLLPALVRLSRGCHSSVEREGEGLRIPLSPLRMTWQYFVCERGETKSQPRAVPWPRRGSSLATGHTAPGTEPCSPQGLQHCL